MFRGRKYVSGCRWCFWRWTDGNAGNDNVTRLHIFKAPFGALVVHFIHGPDIERWEHDHPVTFLSIILRGGYVERRGGLSFRRRRLNMVWALDAHRITKADPNTVTLCIMGPKVREWGFHTDRGWVMWRDYMAAAK